MARARRPSQIVAIVARLLGRPGSTALVTSVPRPRLRTALREAYPDIEIDDLASHGGRWVRLPDVARKRPGRHGGDSRPAGGPARRSSPPGCTGPDAELIADVGVAGLHRILAVADRLHEADCLIVVAGMEGALPSVVGGLTGTPLIALPTSTGYGVGAGGFAALAGMLASCAPGIVVVNIDNGYGAGVFAARVARRTGSVGSQNSSPSPINP